MNLSVMPNVNTNKSHKDVGFKGGYANINGAWKDMLKGGKAVSADEFVTQNPVILEVSGVGSKIIDFLPAKIGVIKQKLALTGDEAKEFEALVEKKSPDLRLFLNKFFVGEFRLTDSKKMYVNNLNKAATDSKETPIVQMFQHKNSA